jgi:hypothetical protein
VGESVAHLAIDVTSLQPACKDVRERSAGDNTELSQLGNRARKSPAGNGYAHAALNDPRMCHDLGIPSDRRETRGRKVRSCQTSELFEQLAKKVRR